MTDPLKTAQDAAHAAIARLADAGHRAATEHAHALDALRAEVEALRTQNTHLRERLAALDVRPVDTEAPRDRNHEIVWGSYAGRRAFCRVGGDPAAVACETRSAVEVSVGRWWLMRPCEYVSFFENATEAQAIAWVLDGVLP